jgi:hypothetical protein
VSMKVVVVGQNPAILKTERRSGSLVTLYRWLDILNIRQVSFCNVYEYPGKFSVKDVNLDQLRTYVESYNKVITLGTIPDRILTDLGIHHFALPHPSGLNRRLNDKAFVREELSRCREYLRS